MADRSAGNLVLGITVFLNNQEQESWGDRSIPALVLRIITSAGITVLGITVFLKQSLQ
jgi:hypothetical protein